MLVFYLQGGIKMSKFAGFLSAIAGIAVLAGEYVGSLQKYYLVTIGGIIAILAGIGALKNPY